MIYKRHFFSLKYLTKPYLLYVVNTFGPVTQSKFLHSMGITTRLSMLLNQTTSIEQHKILFNSYKRLVDPLTMGRIYKVLAINPKNFDQIPYGFESLKK